MALAGREASARHARHTEGREGPGVRAMRPILTRTLGHFLGTAGGPSAVTQSATRTPGWVPPADLIPFKGGSQSPNKEKFSQA